MSALLAPSPEEQAGAPQLRLQPLTAKPAKLRRMPFMVVLLGFLGVGMAGVLLLATSLQGQTNELNELQRQAAALRYEQAALMSQVEDARSSQQLASRAWELGMRPNPHPVVIVLPEGTVLGEEIPAPGNAFPGMAPRPQEADFKPPVGVSDQPTEQPSAAPTQAQSAVPTQAQSAAPTEANSSEPTPAPQQTATQPIQGG